MELFLCSILPLMLMLAIWARVKSWSTGRLWYVRLPVLLVSAGAMAGIYYIGKLSAPMLFPQGQAVHEEITDAITSLGPDYNSLKANLPDSFKQLVEQVVEAKQTAPTDSIEELVAKAHGPQFVLTWWTAVAEGDDDHLLEARRKSLELDKLLAKDHPQDCGLRAQPAAPNLTAAVSNGIDEANKIKDSAYADAFNNGKEAKRQPLSKTEGLTLRDATLKGVIADEDMDRLLGKDLSDPAKTCQLRIAFAEAALASPRAADLLRFMTSTGQQ
jgi:hypothetical protein